METLARCTLPTLVAGEVIHERAMGEYDLIPAYQFLEPDGTPRSLNDLFSLGVVIVGRRIDPDEGLEFTQGAYITDSPNGICRPATSPSPYVDGPTAYANEMYHQGTYRLQYRVGGEGGPYLYSSPIFVRVVDYGTDPIAALGGST